MRRMEQRTAAMLGLIAVVLATAACSSPATKAASHPESTQVVTTTPPATATAAAAGSGSESGSKRYGFRLTLPTGWSSTDAQSAWAGKQLEGLASPAFANFSDPAMERTFAVAAAPIAKGVHLAAWRAAMVRAAPSVCTESASAESATLGGEPALAWTSKCSDGFAVIKLATLHGDRGYMTLLGSSATGEDAANRHIWESIRRSFRFTG
jgi:hypothetical protein